MRLSTRLGTALVGAGLALLQGVRGGFEDTLPVMMLCTQDIAPCVRAQQLHGSSQASGVRLTTPENIVSYTAKDKSICGLDGIFMFEIGGLTSSSMKALPSNSSLKRRTLDAPSQMAFQHVSKSHGDFASELRHHVLRMCSSARRGAWTSTSNADLASLQTGQKTFLSYKADLLHLEALFNHDLEAFMRTHPNSLVFVTADLSSPQSRSWTRRALEEAAKDDGTGAVVDDKLGLFHRYQFFSTGLLVGILVVAFLLTPIAFYATQLLSSIETPDQLGQKSRPSAAKKNQ